MLMTIGKKYLGESVEILMLKNPDYVKYVTEQTNLTGPLAKVQAHMNTLIEKFDSKPFIGKMCSAHDCDKPATRFTVYRDNLSPYWWCESCDPYQFSAPAGNLMMPNDYRAALLHVQWYCNGRLKDYRALIRHIARAKGLPERAGEKQAQIFFSG